MKKVEIPVVVCCQPEQPAETHVVSDETRLCFLWVIELKLTYEEPLQKTEANKK